MSEKVSSFYHVDIKNFTYLFLIAGWNDFVTPIKEELEKQTDPFGEVLGLNGKVIQPYKSKYEQTFNEVVKKKWPDEISNRIREEQDPFMVIINKDFKKFNPQENPWAIVWFSDYRGKTDSIYRLFGGLAQKVRNKEDLLDYLKALSGKEKFRKISKYIDLKSPEIFGISINFKAILDDVFD